FYIQERAMRRVWKGLEERRAVLILSLVLVGSLLTGRDPRAGQREPQRQATPNETAAEKKSETFAESFEKVWKTVRNRFWDKKLNGVDWDQIGETYRKRLPDVRSKSEFAELVNRML